MRVLIHSNGPHVPTGYGKQAKYAGRIMRELGHEVAFSCFYGLAGQPIRWDDYTLFPAGQVDFGLDVLPFHARSYGADVIMPIMDLWKLAPIARELGDGAHLMAPLVITDCEAPDGGPSIPDRQVIGALGGYPAAVCDFGLASLTKLGIKTFKLPHTFDPKVYTRFSDDDRAALRKENGTEGKFVIGICGANKDAVRKGFMEQFAAFAEFSKRHPNAMLNVFSIYNTKNGHNLVELAASMGIDSDKIMWMPIYEQVSGLLGEEFMAAWYNSIDVLSMCSYGEGFGVPAIEAQACGTPVIGTNCSALTELVRDAGWLVSGQKFWNPVHRAWWVRPSHESILWAWEKAYNDRGNSARSARAVAFAAAYAYDHVRDTFWPPYLAKLEEVARVLKEAKTGVVTYDGLKWKSERLTEDFGDALALEHESDYAPHITGRLQTGDVFVDVGAHVGHWAVRAAAKGAKVIAVEADPVTADRLRENLALNDLDAEVLAVAAWDEHAELHLNHMNQEVYDGTNQVRPEGDGQVVLGVPLDDLLLDQDRIDLIKVDVEGADLQVLRGLRGTVAKYKPDLFIEDHSVYGYFDHAELEALLLGMDYEWEEVAKGYLLATPIKEM